MSQDFHFDPSILHSVVGGRSAIDMPALNFKSLKEVDAFLKGYGFDGSQPESLERIWYFHRRALVLMQEKLGFALEEIPEVLRERKLLEDPRKLLLFASSMQDQNLQKWSCALLRCIHVFVHAENDLFSSFSEEIQKQILSPFQNCIYHDGTSGKTFLKATEDSANPNSEPISLLGFESKPFKTSTSTVIKLLAKPQALAMSVFDKLGVRFITHSMMDTFRVVRFLVDENLISFPHIMPDQSSNNLFPVDLFIRACSELENKEKALSDSEVQGFFARYLERNKDEAEFFRKENAFSGQDYKFIKFISRKLIRIAVDGQKSEFSFFYPFEVQIVDQEAHSKILSGPSDHQAYKERQRQAARKRLFPEPS
ncbi:MAG: TIGR04552 family protein [Pseudobdellovibrionaceae bacterium]